MLTQHIPEHIRAELFAADLAASGSLNSGAVLCRNRSIPVAPLPNRRGRKPKAFGELGFAAYDLAGLGNRVLDRAHTDSMAQLLTLSYIFLH